jgi:hypothetical protein
MWPDDRREGLADARPRPEGQGAESMGAARRADDPPSPEGGAAPSVGAGDRAGRADASAGHAPPAGPAAGAPHEIARPEIAPPETAPRETAPPHDAPPAGPPAGGGAPAVAAAVAGEAAALSPVQARRAIEALRAGVPNRDAVLALGGGQPRIEARFRDLLDRAADDVARGAQTPGLLVAGDFGTGKSHLLEALEGVALRENFVCSTLSVSKETPLHDPDKLYRAAVNAAVVPGRRGSALTEVAFSLKFDSQGYRDLAAWAADPASGLGSRFPASLFVFERSRDEETRDRIIAFWGGDPLDARQLRGWLRDQGEAATYRLERVGKKDLPLQHFRFTSRLISAAGYAGWVLLVDELELIGQYSFKARARAYAELARWAGRLRAERCPGLVTLFAITQDFATVVLRQRNDLERIPGRLRASGLDADATIADHAEVGMRTIERDPLRLVPPDPRHLDALREEIRRLHGLAYGWQPPALDAGERATSTSMRQYVRRWINEWDLLRLYPDYRPAVVSEAFWLDYAEDPDLERPTEGDGGAGDEAGAGGESRRADPLP